MNNCIECQTEEHDSCPLLHDCPCCRNTMEGILELGMSGTDCKFMCSMCGALPSVDFGPMCFSCMMIEF